MNDATPLTDAQATAAIEALGAGYWSGPVSRVGNLPDAYRGLVAEPTPGLARVELDGPYSLADLRAIVAIMERVAP